MAALILNKKGGMHVSTVFRDSYTTVAVYVYVPLLYVYLALDICQGTRPRGATSPVAARAEITRRQGPTPTRDDASTSCGDPLNFLGNTRIGKRRKHHDGNRRVMTFETDEGEDDGMDSNGEMEGALSATTRMPCKGWRLGPSSSSSSAARKRPYAANIMRITITRIAFPIAAASCRHMRQMTITAEAGNMINMSMRNTMNMIGMTDLMSTFIDGHGIGEEKLARAPIPAT